MSRIAIFIDAGYLDNLLKGEFSREGKDGCGAPIKIPPKIDLHKFSLELAREIEILRTYYYDCLPYQSPIPTEEESRRVSSKRKYFAALRRLPCFEVREGRLEFRGNDKKGKPMFEQKRVDTLLALDLALLSGKKQITHAALVTGDSDFIPVIKVVKSEGVLVWLYHGFRPHSDLWETADERFSIDQALIDRVKM